MLRRQRERGELRRLELAAKHRRGEVDPSEREPWEAAKARLWAEGSFGELDVALRELEAERPLERAAVELAYGWDAELRTLSAGLRRRAEAAVCWLAERMPERIVVPDWALRPAVVRGRWANGDARARRDAELRALRRDGVGVRELARRFGLDPGQVARIVGERRAS